MTTLNHISQFSLLHYLIQTKPKAKNLLSLETKMPYSQIQCEFSACLPLPHLYLKKNQALFVYVGNTGRPHVKL